MNSIFKPLSVFVASILFASLLLVSCSEAVESTSVNTTASAMPTPAIATTAVPETTAMPVTTTVPTTTTNSENENEPVTEDDPAKYALQVFENGLSAINKSVTIVRELNAEELDAVKAFSNLPDVILLYGASYQPFYRPEDISLYELLYASDIQTEYPDNPFQNDGSMMTTARIREIVEKYLGIQVTQEMLDRLVAEGAEYYPELDAYGYAHYDCGGFRSSGELYGYMTEDGKLLVHLKTVEDNSVWVLLNPIEDGYRIEAAQWIQ